MKVDYHVHTRFSVDSEASLHAYCEKAINDGMDEIVFTDHIDLFGGNGLEPDQIIDYEGYDEALKNLQDEYKNRLVIKKGLELGVQLPYIKEYEDIVKDNNLDFAIMSCHQIDNEEFWLNDYQRGKTSEECFRGYYEYLIQLHQAFKDYYSVLGHLDLMKRYCSYTLDTDKEQKAIIMELLKQVIEDGKGIEINTSGIRYKLGDFHPAKEILEWYYELGGRIITFGSDAHTVMDLGKDIDVAKAELKKIGFKEFCTFEKMKPIFHKL
ncbi:histidinol-phosphatase (PHP family) [Breznakia sp. PF5-3]|uniref:histidinol-phosphatase HisJ family protein n=1 Tax=unclassified Breznakia TaxID=2623764 RepID=UPI00240504B9|nr:MULTISPECIES: histidinol-phosphatase HisJ family protein [unclassified Breznakia]MDF9825893.1 histidinol-phosphatase (PHP family) [Breznakia sp. PM6-1]MDF9836690.1 histidinol-phosphatase (PHP family) [Breznakia sp. PF5-3]MDF9838966.1 histidinol-phosphatase (PHP family) [Breznakia sp. PFB2-8]MDF9860984.1 histidinol-phosphatase (PHP family) [Breznakia sp. PH5-24]